MAAANATTRSSSFFHPGHLLARCNYSEASTYPCAACERVVTGTGYRCGECNFNIHEACLSLPYRVNFDGHPGGHALTLSRLGASRWCDVCKETSHAGRYMYLCRPCKFPRHQQPAPQQPGPPRRRNRYRGVFKVIKFGVRVANFILNPHTFIIDLFTGN